MTLGEDARAYARAHAHTHAEKLGLASAANVGGS